MLKRLAWQKQNMVLTEFFACKPPLMLLKKGPNDC